MFTLSIENRFGEIISLSHNHNYVITDIDGLNPPDGEINITDVAGMDGGLFNSSKVQCRNIVLTILPQVPVEKNRLNLYRYFQSGQWCKIYYSNGSLAVQIEGYVEKIDTGLFSKSETMQISILCPRPYFEALYEIYNDISSLISDFEFPFAIQKDGIDFSHVEQNTASTIINTGDMESGIMIYITARGRVLNPTIYSVTNRGSIGLNLEMANHDLLVINTNSGERSIKLISENVETNIINKLRSNPEWFVLSPGENIFTYDAEAGADLMSIVFRHRTKYGGV